MKPQVANRRHSTSLHRLLLLGAAVSLSVGAVSVLNALGIIELPFRAKPKAPPPPPTGVPVPLTSRAIPAYTKITRDFLIDQKTGAPGVIYLAADQIEKHAYITSPSKILGRVLRRDKSAGYAFTEQDFFPEGTRPGLVAGIPPGQLAFVIAEDKIRGIHGLKAGDRFALLGTAPKEKPAAPPGATSHGRTATSASRPNIRVLVQNGMMVTPVPPAPSETGNAQSRGQSSRSAPPVGELTIAVSPEDVMPLSEALAAHCEIICVARSGRPDDPGQAALPVDTRPPATNTAIEIIVGGRRHTTFFPPNMDAPAEPPAPVPPALPGDVRR